MPNYSYKCEFCKRTMDKFRTVATRNRRFPCGCGRRMVRDFSAEMGMVKVTPPGNWPMESTAMGCNPSEVARMEAHSREAGVPTHFNPETGDAILVSRTHRRQYAEVIGLIDRNAGPGDPTPR